MLAQAMRFAHHPTPWVSVDGETGGPILSWFLLLPRLLGLPFSFQAEHLVAALCLACTLVAASAAARALAGDRGSWAGLVAGSLWLALSPDENFTHYSSELLPDLLIAWSLVLWLGARERGGGGFGLVAAGFILGLVPWAKLQAVPIALGLGLWMLGSCLVDARVGFDRRLKRAGFLIAAALLPTAALADWVRWSGGWDQFWQSYIVANWARAGGKDWSGHGSDLVRLVFRQEGAFWFVDTGLLFLAALLVRGRKGFGAVAARDWTLVVGLFLAALAAALSPLTQYPHYEQLCLVPLILLVACGARVLLGPPGADNGAPKRRGLAWLGFALALLPASVGYFLAWDGPSEFAQTWNYSRTLGFQPQSFVVDSVRQFTLGARSIAVWGWAPYLYVDLGLPPTTRDAGYASMTDGNPSEAFIRAGFLRDLEAAPPDAIVDTEDDIVGDTRRTAPSTFPELAAFLASNYRMVGRGTATHGPGRSLLVDIYLRK